MAVRATALFFVQEALKRWGLWWLLNMYTVGNIAFLLSFSIFMVIYFLFFFFAADIL